MAHVSLTAPLIPVRGGTVAVDYLKVAGDTRRIHHAIDRWETSIGEDVTPPQRDAVEFARLAADRWAEACRQKRTVSSINHLQLAINDHPRQELRLLAIANAKFMRRDSMVGITLFRRTWCNNIALDF